MKTRRWIRRGAGRAGFSLVEVSLAIAICAVGLMALVGLLPTGIDASRRAADDTLAASIGNDLIQWRRISSYTNTAAYPAGAGSLLNTGTYQFNLDSMGNTASNDDGTVNSYYSDPYFLIKEQVIVNPQFAVSPDTKRLLITIQWPCNPSTGIPNVLNSSTRTFIADMTRMQ